MAEFQKIHDFGDKVHEQYLLPMDYCKHLITTEEDARKVLKRAQILAKISKKKGINTSQLNNARNSLESRLENLHGVMSSCNLNNYQSAKAKKPEIMAEIRKSVQAEKAIYEKQKHSYNMPKFTIPLRSPSPMAYHNAWNQTMRSVVQTYKQAMNVASHIDSSGNLEKALTQSMRTYIHGQKSPPVKNVHKKFGLAHDNKPSEQFAAAGDSLLNGHKGKLTYLPLRFKLNKNVLNAMEGLTYRGAHIFKKPVDNY